MEAIWFWIKDQKQTITFRNVHFVRELLNTNKVWRLISGLITLEKMSTSVMIVGGCSNLRRVYGSTEVENIGARFGGVLHVVKS